MSAGLTALGLDPAAERLYRELLRAPYGRRGRAPEPDDHNGHTGEHSKAAAALVRLGLARRSEDGELVAITPGVALESVVDEELAKVEQRRRELEEVRVRIAELAAEHLVGQSEGWSPAPVLVVGTEVRAVIEDLARSVTGELLVLHEVPPQARGPWGVDVAGVVRALTRRDQPVRCVYPVEALYEPEREAYVRFVIAQDCVVRLVERVPHRLLVFGHEAAIVSSVDAARPVHHIVRAPELLRTVRSLFELYWESGVPFRRGDAPEEDARARLVELLATGMKDEAIARHLQLSLRTVRRRVAGLLDELGATTRFQAGMQAARRRLI
ncbi:MAG TPA: helix-turn-helix domain-containing protein [Actinomycetes bacterium]|nr:helix-turn-helix domain-containing protein [Actinomycetes bacterium]